MQEHKELQTHLQALEKGLFMMSRDRIRALSTHETEDLVDELRLHVSRAQKLLLTSQEQSSE